MRREDRWARAAAGGAGRARAPRATAGGGRRDAGAGATPSRAGCSATLSGSRSARPLEQARRERVEALGPPVAVGAGAAPKRNGAVTSSTSAPARASAAASSWSYAGVKAGGSASTTRMGSTVERLLVRTWNLFHGNTKPPGRKGFLDEMVAARDCRCARHRLSAGGPCVGAEPPRSLERHDGGRRRGEALDARPVPVRRPSSAAS